MIAEKVTAAQAAWWGAGAAFIAAAPRLARARPPTAGMLAIWEATFATTVQASTAMLDIHKAMMTPVWSTVRANQKRLARKKR